MKCFRFSTATFAAASVLLLAGTLGVGYRAAYPPEKTYRVPLLWGPDAHVRERDLHELKPLHWAMMLDIVGGSDSFDAYHRMCLEDPTLKDQVEGEFDRKASIDDKMKRNRR